MFRGKLFVGLALVAMMTLSGIIINPSGAQAATNQFRGVNWADQRDNYQSGNLYVSGLGASDTYASASIVADRVVSQFVSKLGANSVRMPINETTVNGSYWNTYTGAIDKALTYGKVILCYWAYNRSKPVSMTNWWNMWTTVVKKYSGNPNCYFEVFNEPVGYNATELCNLYNEWANTRFTSVPKGRIILDGTNLAQGVSDVGRDSRLSSCLLAVHEYTMFASPYTSESQWQNHFKGYVGNYASRTVCTEWGYPNSPGSKNGVSYGYIDYNAASGGSNYFYYYARAISKQLRAWNMGSFYWPGLRDADWYSMTVKSGSGANINLSIPNASGFYWLKYAWGDNSSGTPTPTQSPMVTPTPTKSTAVTPTPTPTPTPTATQSTTGCTVSYSQSDWGGGASVTVTIKNNGTAAIEGWTLAWNFAGNQTITNMWNATYTQSGTAVTVKNTSYNASIPAKGSASFGFNLSYSGSNAKPARFTLNGTVCEIQ